MNCYKQVVSEDKVGMFLGGNLRKSAVAVISSRKWGEIARSNLDIALILRKKLELKNEKYLDCCSLQDIMNGLEAGNSVN